MSEQARNVELLRKAYGFGSETRGMPYMAAFQRGDELKEYFTGLSRDWESMEFEVEHFVAQGDCVVTYEFYDTAQVLAAVA